jgi:hypothetical protein
MRLLHAEWVPFRLSPRYPASPYRRTREQVDIQQLHASRLQRR